jgi:hypothetical protein
LQTPGWVVSMLSRGSTEGVSTPRRLALRHKSRNPVLFFEVQEMAQLMLAPLTMDVGEGCSRATWTEPTTSTVRPPGDVRGPALLSWPFRESAV